MDKEDKEKEKEGKKSNYSSPLSPFSHTSSRTSSPKSTRRTKLSNPDISSHMISLDENKPKSRSPKLKMNLREKFRKNLFGNNSKLVRLNRASSDNPRSPSSRDFPTFHFSPDELSHSEFGGISEHDSEIHYLEEFRNEVDKDFKPAYLCEPKSRLVTFNFAAINQQQQVQQQQQQQLQSQSQSEIEFSKSLFNNAEWKAYKKWVKLVFNKNPEYFNESRKIMTTRMTIFLHFYHLEIPITTITENYIKTQSDWCLEGYEVMNYASFIQIPLNENYSPYWWCNPYINPPTDQCPFGFSNLCHYYQTKVVDSNLNNTRMKYKKIKEELRKYVEEFESITSILTSDPFTQNIYIKLLMRWAIASKGKISHKIRLNSCIVLSHLTFPRERIVGLREKLMKSGVVFVILTYARRGELYVTQHVELNQIELDHFLDSGAVGKVHLGKWNGIDVAVKMCQGSSVAFVINEFRFEVALMTILSHPHLLPCFAAKLTSPSPYLIVSPYQSKGSLKKVLMDEFEEMNDIKKIWVAYCISNAVNYLHKYKIIHRDIKSQNILIGEEWSQVYLTDFGTSRFLGKFDGSPLESFVGTNEYMAPELLHHPEDGKAGIDYDFKADVYSFGILLFEIITRTTPYEGLKSYLVADRVIAGHRPSPPLGKSFNDYIKVKEMIELMKSCWAPNPKKRPSFTDIKHKLFSLLNKYFKGEELRLLFTSTQTSHLHNQTILVSTLNQHSPLDNHHHSSGGSLNHSGSSNNNYSGVIIISNNSSSLSSSGNPGLKLTDSSINSLHPSSSKHSDFPSSECHSLIPPKKSKQKKKKRKVSKDQTANNNNNNFGNLSSSTPSPSIAQALNLPPLPYNRHHRYQLTHQSPSDHAKKDEGKLEEIFSDFGDEFTKEVMMLEQHFDKLKCLSDQGIEEELDSEIDLDFDMNGNPDELPPQTMGLPFDLNSLSSLSPFPPRKNSH